jgi:hypothetical protein
MLGLTAPARRQPNAVTCVHSVSKPRPAALFFNLFCLASPETRYLRYIMSDLNASDTCLIPAKRSRTASDSRFGPQGNPLTRKRTRGNPLSPRDESAMCPSPGPLIVERRRVNPDSLAKRLGPDLVRDMEKHIYPGNKDMPTFAVRKELQERYNIDRRHIYDYFHSRGLRVVKEDRHGNLLRARENNRRALVTDVTILHIQGAPPLTPVLPV